MTRFRIMLLVGMVASADCGGSTNKSSPTCENVTPALTKAAVTDARNDALAGETPGATALIREASREFDEERSTVYTHIAAVDEATGRFDYDCSGFLSYAMRSVLPLAYNEIAAGNPAPKTRDFVQAFTNLPAGDLQFVRVVRGLDLRPGDIVAWLLPAGSEDTGHIVIVAGTPTVSPDRSDEVLVPVIDSTSRPHGVADTRVGSTGLGMGTIGLLLDADGALVGHRWAGGCGDAKGEVTVAVRPR